MLFKYLSLVSLLAGLFLSTSNAAITASISGGSGTPVSVTISEEITFTNVGTGRGFYGFVLVDVAPGNAFSGFNAHTGTIGWNGGGTNSGTGGMGTSAFADITVNDLFAIWGTGNDAPLTTATMTLSPGTRTSGGSVDGIYPQGSGNYEIRVFDATTFGFISDPGTQPSIPEPATYAMFLGSMALAGTLLRRRLHK